MLTTIVAEVEDEAVTSTTSLLGEHSQRVQSFQTSRVAEHANADQINAISEMTLILLKKRIPIQPSTLAKLKRHKDVLRKLAKRKNSLKRRREHLKNQNGSGFWKGLRECFEVMFVKHSRRKRIPARRHRRRPRMPQSQQSQQIVSTDEVIATSQPKRRTSQRMCGLLASSLPTTQPRLYSSPIRRSLLRMQTIQRRIRPR